ncbi:MAG: hypothetical protein HS108_14570 [Planctomycetes bacterium]|nr:hypothetical protein [Planctomycetota bacterium]
MKCLSFVLSLLMSGSLFAQPNQPSPTDGALDWLVSKVAPPGSSKEDIEFAREVCKYAVGARETMPGMEVTKTSQAAELAQNSTLFAEVAPFLRMSALSNEDRAFVLARAMAPSSNNLPTRMPASDALEGLKLVYVGLQQPKAQFTRTTIDMLKQVFPEATLHDHSRTTDQIDWQAVEVLFVGPHSFQSTERPPISRIDQVKLWEFVKRGGLLIVAAQVEDRIQSWIPDGQRATLTSHDATAGDPSLNHVELMQRRTYSLRFARSYPTLAGKDIGTEIEEHRGPRSAFTRWSEKFRPLTATALGRATMLEMDIGQGKLLMLGDDTDNPGNIDAEEWYTPFFHLRAYVNWRADLVKNVRTQNEANPTRRKPPESADTSATPAPQTPGPDKPASPLAQINQNYLWVGGGVLVALVLIAVIAGRKRTPRQNS